MNSELIGGTVTAPVSAAAGSSGGVLTPDPQSGRPGLDPHLLLPAPWLPDHSRSDLRASVDQSGFFLNLNFFSA